MCDRVWKFLQELPHSKEIDSLHLRLGELAGLFGREDEPDQIESVGGRATGLSNLHRLGSCEICAYVAEKLWEFLGQYQYDLIVRPDEQQAFANRGGFCPFHTWEYETIASPYGICNGYPGLLDRLAAELRDAALIAVPRDVLLTKMRSLLPTPDDYVLCVVRDKAEQEAIAATARRSADNESYT